MTQPNICCRIPSAWLSQVQDICDATGQTPSEVAREALALYLKRSKAVTVRSRLDELEAKIQKLAQLITNSVN